MMKKREERKYMKKEKREKIYKKGRNKGEGATRWVLLL